MVWQMQRSLLSETYHSPSLSLKLEWEKSSAPFLENQSSADQQALHVLAPGEWSFHFGFPIENAS